MKLLFENWRKYLNEVTLDQASERLFYHDVRGAQGKTIIKMVKGVIWKVAKFLPEYGRFSTIRDNQKYIEILSYFVSSTIWNTVAWLDLEDGEKGTALNWLISLLKKDEDLALKLVMGVNDSMSQKVYSDLVNTGSKVRPIQLRHRDLSPMSNKDSSYSSWNKIDTYKVIEQSYDLLKMDPKDIETENPGVWEQYKKYRRNMGDHEFQTRPFKDWFSTTQLNRIVGATVSQGTVDGIIGQMPGQDLRRILEKFFHYQEFMPEKDLYKIESIPKLYDVVEKADDEIAAHQEKQLYLDAEEGTEIFRNDNYIMIAALHNKGAACQLGKGTDWCTAAPGLDYFSTYYNPDDPLIFIQFQPDGNKFQFHYGTEQFMDANDAPLDHEDAMELHVAVAQTDIPNKYPQIGEYLESTLGITTTMTPRQAQEKSDAYGITPSGYNTDTEFDLQREPE